MANVTPTVLIVTRDPDVKQVSSVLHAEGITSKTAASPREIQRVLGGIKGRCVAVLVGSLAGDRSSPIADIMERLRDLPLLVLVPVEGDGIAPSDSQRTSVEDYARKPLAAS